MFSLAHMAALHQTCRDQDHQYQSQDTLYLFADLSGIFFHKSGNEIGKYQYHHNDQDYNGRQGIDGRVNSFGHVIDHNGNIFYAVS